MHYDINLFDGKNQVWVLYIYSLDKKNNSLKIFEYMLYW